MKLAKTLGELKNSKYVSQSIHEEIRKNLIQKISNKEKLFEGIHGYEDSVIPDVERALLSGHNILFLGLRGQAKTKMARLMAKLLDEYVPVVSGSEINDDPLNPISKFAKETIAQLGDETPIDWIHRDQRYVEKLATPDVSIADLLGDIDPIKAASRKIEFSDEYAIHFGLIPRSNRSIFVINELPDLQNRIQVALFNILEEGDVQIRGFKFKLPLNILFVFTANPEDYTQRGNIITPLKDRIQSQILTHYPNDLQISAEITQQEIKVDNSILSKVQIHPILKILIEQICFCARNSPYVDPKSGVSARLSISALELLYSSVYRRMLQNQETSAHGRISDLISVVPALTGKIELVYEGEQLGIYEVAVSIIDDAIKALAPMYIPKIDSKKKSNPREYSNILAWFSKGGHAEWDSQVKEKDYSNLLKKIPFDIHLTQSIAKNDLLIIQELILHYLSSHNIIQKSWYDQRLSFKDPLSGMLSDLNLQ